MNSRFLSIFIILTSFLSSAIDADENESAKTDILFLKIQELEIEIAELRNKIAVSYTHLTLTTKA